jgi:hypothetical protein
MHTNVSDGTYMPRDLVALAKEKHLQAISITDHDEVGAYAQLTTNDRAGIQIFHGCEFSTYYHEKEVHVLGYQFSLEHPELQDYISHFKEVRRSRIHKMVDKCADAGYDISYEELVNTFTDAVSFGRPHIAQLLIAHGYVETVGEAFDTMLNPNGPCFVPKEKYEPQQAIDLIHRAGGIAVLAHPKLVENDTYVHELLELPFDGVEVYHSSHSTKDSTKYRKIAETRGLLISGGSDFHGIQDRFPESIGLGEYEIQHEWVANFMKALQGA